MAAERRRTKTILLTKLRRPERDFAISVPTPPEEPNLATGSVNVPSNDHIEDADLTPGRNNARVRTVFDEDTQVEAGEEQEEESQSKACKTAIDLAVQGAVNEKIRAINSNGVLVLTLSTTGNPFMSKVDAESEAVHGDLKKGFSDMNDPQKAFEELIYDRVKSSSSAGCVALTNIPDRTLPERHIAYHESKGSETRPLIDNYLNSMGARLEMLHSEFVLEAPVGYRISTRKLSCLLGRGCTLCPLQLQHLIEGTPNILGRRANAISSRVKRLSNDDMRQVVKAWKIKIEEFGVSGEFHKFWCAPDRPAASRKVDRVLAILTGASNTTRLAISESIEPCFVTKKINGGESLPVSMSIR